MNQKEQQNAQAGSGFRSGFIPILGRPNVGKSSIMNAMIGEKIAIVSHRPQTTRNRIMGVVTAPGCQMVFLDTPGIHDPRTKLGEYMMHSVRDAMDGMDCLLMVADVTSVREKDLEIARSVCEKKVPRVLAINKTDLVKPEEILTLFGEKKDRVLIDVKGILPRKEMNGIDGLRYWRL